MEYPDSLRRKVVEKALAGGTTQDALAEEFGISRSSIQNWVRKHRRLGANKMPSKEKSPRSWTRAERLESLLETHALDEQARGTWCRQHGVHTHHLEQWRRELTEGVPTSSGASEETRSLRQENKSLKKELRRKEKALAETTALLVLKRKAAAIWGETEDD